MINAHVPKPTETCQELPQCLEEATMPCEAPIGRELTEMDKVESPESKRQRDERRRIEIIKNWPVTINFHDRGCVVMVGCKSIAFESIEAAYKEIRRYLEDPKLVATQHGFGDYL
jgi:hypothetical protein